MARKPALAADVQADVTDTPSKSRSYGVNHFRLLGRMTADPQQRFTQSGKAVVNLGIATNVNGFAEFHDVVAWEKAAAEGQGKNDEAFWHAANALWHASREYARRHHSCDTLHAKISRRSTDALGALTLEYELEASALLALRHAVSGYRKLRSDVE